jgi:hypothetical protein
LPVRSGVDPATVLADAVRLAREDGWVPRNDPPLTGTWVLTKTADGHHLETGISVQDVDGRRTLVIDMVDNR